MSVLEGLRALDQIQVMAGPFCVKVLGNPVKLSASPAAMRKAAPVLGEDTEAILAELGHGPAEIARLREKGVLGP
jgi:crotonobetainyl-CoA:carnitine CoA-transferase CaiB-like acyl-CoA transferase